MRRLALTTACLCPLLFVGPASAQVYRWGDEEAAPSIQTTPLETTGLPAEPTVVDASNASSYALVDGSVYAIGNGAHGDIGGPKKSYDAWVKVNFPEEVTITAIGEARDSGFAIDSNGQGWAWGAGGDGMFCNGDRGISTPAKVPVTDAVAVQGGSDHVLWLLKDQKILGCGENEVGQLGLGASMKGVTTLTEVPGLSGIEEISAGQRQSLARTRSGTVYAFGENDNGESCGPRETKKVVTPTEVAFPGRVEEVSAGGSVPANGSSMFMVEGVPYGCGSDKEGQLGDGQTADKFGVTLSSGLLMLGLERVVTGGQTSMGLAKSGEVYTWGSGTDGDLGNGSETGFSLTPLPVASGHEVSATAKNLNVRG